MHARSLVSDVFFGFRSFWFDFVLAWFFFSYPKLPCSISIQWMYLCASDVDAVENIFFQFFPSAGKVFFSCICVSLVSYTLYVVIWKLNSTSMQ